MLPARAACSYLTLIAIGLAACPAPLHCVAAAPPGDDLFWLAGCRRPQSAREASTVGPDTRPAVTPASATSAVGGVDDAFVLLGAAASTRPSPRRVAWAPEEKPEEKKAAAALADERLDLPSIRDATLDLTPKPQEIDGEATSTALPRSVAATRFGAYPTATPGGNERVRFAVTPYLWVSPAMRHGPLYFEQVNLERYGTHRGGYWRASAGAVSGFVARTLSMPYQVADVPPRACRYTLGVYRPGGCTPHFFHLSTPSVRGLAAQCAAVTGLVFLVP